MFTLPGGSASRPEGLRQRGVPRERGSRDGGSGQGGHLPVQDDGQGVRSSHHLTNWTILLSFSHQKLQQPPGQVPFQLRVPFRRRRAVPHGRVARLRHVPLQGELKDTKAGEGRPDE